MRSKISLLAACVMLCCLLFSACGSGNASPSASSSVVSSSFSSTSSASVSKFTKDDFKPAFFEGKDTATVSYDPATDKVLGIQFLFNPEGFDMELNVSEGTIYDANAQSHIEGQDYKFQSGPNSAVYWLPAASDGTPIASSEVTFTVYQNGAPSVSGTVDFLRLGDTNQYLAILSQIRGL